MKINWNQIETKWRAKWDESKDFETNPNEKPKKFITVAYPYPNSPQHIGHGRTYTLADVHARFYRMQGFNVLFPMGFHYTGTPVLGMAKRIQSQEKEILDGLVNNVHLEKKEIRFWGSPDNQNTWGMLLFADVDLINTDNIEKCKKFIIKTKY